MTGREMRTKLDLIKPPPAHNEERNVDMEERFNTYHGARYKEFNTGDAVFFKLTRGNDWTWQPGTVIQRRGNVDYLIQTHSTTGEGKVRRHANQLRLRCTNNQTSNKHNVLMDFFDLRPTQRVVEPTIVPQHIQPPQATRNDLEDEPDPEGEPEPPPTLEPPQLRRSERATAGIMPPRYADYEVGVTSTLNGGEL